MLNLFSANPRANRNQGFIFGIFQLETSSGMKQVARDMRPSNMEDISALIALYRPGPMDWIVGDGALFAVKDDEIGW